MEIIQEIGSYAGFAAVVGLAVLSALYFSQARDLRRLREWAGRAPERAAENEARMRAATEAAQRAAAAAAGGAAAQPAQAQEAQTAAGQAAQAPTAQSGAGPHTAVLPAADREEAAAGATSGNGASAPPDQEAAEAPAGDEDAAPAVPAATPAAGAAARRPLPPPRAIPSPPPRLPSPAPGYGASTPAVRSPWYRRIGVGRAALALLAVVVIAGAGAVALSRLGGEQSTGRGADAAGGGAPGAAQSPTDPSRVTFAVLNGTTVDGLARRFADRLEAAGYRRGNVTNATEQEQAESVVLYAADSRRAAQQVARRLDIGQTERIDPRSQALAGDATVVVVLGNDKVSG